MKSIRLVTTIVGYLLFFQSMNKIIAADPIVLQPGGYVHGAAWNTDESLVVTWTGFDSGRTGAVHVWDLSDRTALMTLTFDSTVNKAVWNSDDTRILMWTGDGTIVIWDLTGQTQPIELHHNNWVNGAAWNSDESKLLSWSNDGTARIWDLVGDSPPTILQHNSEVSARWSRDETHVYSSDGYDTLYIWDLNDIENPTILHGEGIGFPRFNLDVTRRLSWITTDIRIWSINGSTPLTVFHHDLLVRGAVWSADGSHILSWGRDGTARWWDVTNSDDVVILQHSTDVDGAVLSRDDSRVVTWGNTITRSTPRQIESRRGSAIVWDLEQRGQPIWELNVSTTIMGAAFNANATQVIVWNLDGTVYIGEISENTPTLVLQHDDRVNGAVLNRDETQIMSWSADGTVRIWNVNT